MHKRVVKRGGRRERREERISETKVTKNKKGKGKQNGRE